MNSPIRKHYDRLKQVDYESWKQFNAALAGEDLLTYFQRSVIRKGLNPNLRLIPSWIRSCMVKYMGFTDENFDTNTVPALLGNVVELNSGSDDLRKAA